jgi:hypothetical protein
MSESNKERDEDLERVKKAVSDLGEHFDTVQIFITRQEPGQKSTQHIALGSGNWFARYGQVREWMIREDESARVSRRDDIRGDEP